MKIKSHENYCAYFCLLYTGCLNSISSCDKNCNAFLSIGEWLERNNKTGIVFEYII